MPYIEPERRWSAVLTPTNPGELNFAITMLILEYYSRMGRGYSSINDVVGALENAKLEFYRRVAAPYEDTKIEENGDVY